jgi:hypothetical protein
MPPLVSHSATTSAPASDAVPGRTSSAYSGLAAVPVEEVLGVDEHALAPAAVRCVTVSRDHAPGSPPASSAGRARRGGRGDLATMQMTGGCAIRPGALYDLRVLGGLHAYPCRVDAERDQRRVAGASRLGLQPRRKNAVSFGIAPGQPPSMNPTPSSSSSRGDHAACPHTESRSGPPAARRRAVWCRKPGSSRGRCAPGSSQPTFLLRGAAGRGCAPLRWSTNSQPKGREVWHCPAGWDAVSRHSGHSVSVRWGVRPPPDRARRGRGKVLQ